MHDSRVGVNRNLNEISERKEGKYKWLTNF